MDPTEQLIIEQLRQGKDEAYKFLYDHHYPVLCHIAVQYVHDEFLGETLVSDTIFHLWEVRETLHIKSTLRSYLIRSVRNRCLDYLKAQSNQREQLVSDVADLPTVRSAESDDYKNISPNDFSLISFQISYHLLAQELEEKIAQAIDSLPADCKRVFKLSRFEGKKQEEIAKELNISVNTVKYHMKRALALLHADLHKYLLALFTLLMQN